MRRDQAHQAFRLMGVEVVHHEMPAGRLRVAGKRACDMRGEIRLRAAWPARRFPNLARDHIPIEDERLCAMPEVLELAPPYLPRCHRQVGMHPFQGLHARQLIGADHPFAVRRPRRCRAIERTNICHLGGKRRIVARREPIADQVRLEIPLLSSRAAWRGEIVATMPRAVISSAISRPLHWLIGRPAVAGAVQASATI